MAITRPSISITRSPATDTSISYTITMPFAKTRSSTSTNGARCRGMACSFGRIPLALNIRASARARALFRPRPSFRYGADANVVQPGESTLAACAPAPVCWARALAPLGRDIAPESRSPPLPTIALPTIPSEHSTAAHADAATRADGAAVARATLTLASLNVPQLYRHADRARAAARRGRSWCGGARAHRTASRCVPTPLRLHLPDARAAAGRGG